MGVYVDFFDSKGVFIDIDCVKRHETGVEFHVDLNREFIGIYKTRHEAQEEGIEKAYEIYNNQLTNG